MFPTFAPQTLLRPSKCPACGRPAAELAPCPWCGEVAPAARATRTDAALLLAAWSATALSLPAMIAGLLAGFLLSFRAHAFVGERAGGTPAPPANATIPLRRAVALGVRPALPALTAATVALLAGRFPVSAAGLRPMAAVLLPILAVALCLGRAPAEPPVPSGSVRARLLARDLPGLILLLLTLPPVFFPSAPVAPGAALGVLCSRLVRPLAWLVFAASVLAVAGPDPSALALGTVLGTAVSVLRA